MSKKQKIKIIRRILIGLIIVLGAVLIWILAGQLRNAYKTGGAAARPENAARAWEDTLHDQILPYFEELSDKALAEQKALTEEGEKEAETGLLKEPVDAAGAQSGPVAFNEGWTYAQFSKIHAGEAVLYRAPGERKGITVAVNAGHGTSGGESVKTQCHPDGSAKVTGGSTAAGATQAVAVSGGTMLLDGTSEAQATLALAQVVKNDLLAAGFDVLMIRDGGDVQLDNIARTVMANNNADCHISLHYDSSTNDKGLFYTSVPDVASYRSMEPVASHWQQHQALGESILAGERQAGVPIFGGGSMEIDLTQTSYSTIPSIDLEVGDRASDHSDAALKKISSGIVTGVSNYF